MNELPHELQKVVERYEVATGDHWSDLPDMYREYTTALWRLHELAGEAYAPFQDTYPLWKPHDTTGALHFWTNHFKFWQTMPPSAETTKALQMCVQGIEGSRRHV